MRIIITGASGFIGRGIVPNFSQTASELILVGRDVKKLKKIFPQQTCTDYQALPGYLTGCDVVIHLAALVSPENKNLPEFETANIELLKSVALLASDAGVGVFVNVATVGGHDNYYSRTKMLGEQALDAFTSLKVVTLRLPAVYGETFKGRLGFLNNVPKFVRWPLFRILAHFAPTVHIDKVATALLAATVATESREELVAD